MTLECVDKSPIINVGKTFVTKFGNITLVSVIDNRNGVIKVEPIGDYLPITRSTTDYALESFYDGLITVKTNFFTLAGIGAHFWVCGEVKPDPAPSTLHVTAITTYEISDPKAVIADIIVNGVGSDILTIDWGVAGSTTHDINGAGQYYFEKVLSDGNHTICATIGNTTPMCSQIQVGTIPETGKEIIFPFSKDITAYWDKIQPYVIKIVKLLGGKSVYLENGTKIVVVL